jgi:Holliday junction DNA helicase RuvB
LKSKARVAIDASVAEGDVFPHTLLFGIGGTGKTAFARAIGNELKCHFVETHAAAYKHRHQLFDALVHYSAEAKAHKKPLFFFLDEVHRLKLPLQEALYSAMKEWWIPTDRGKHHLPFFTLVAATTRFDMLDANSFVTRFENRWEIDRYPQGDIEAIVAYELDKKRMDYDPEVAVDIAKRCLGVPRIAVTLAKKAKDVAMASGRGRKVTLAHTHRAFEMEEIDERGLDPVHRRYLHHLAASNSNGKLMPLGIGVIAAKMGHHEDMIRGSVEPILLQLNMVAPTSRGRILTQKGVEYLRNS